MRVLLLDDSDLVCRAISRMLKRLNCEVVGPFATTKEALTALETEQVDAGLLDFTLRGGTSEPVAVALQADDRPFVLLTGHAAKVTFPDVFSDAIRLIKPITMENLQETLDKVRLKIRG